MSVVRVCSVCLQCVSAVCVCSVRLWCVSVMCVCGVSVVRLIIATRSIGRTGKDFPKYGAPDSILSGRKWWPLPAHVMILSHFLHNEVSPLKISLQ